MLIPLAGVIYIHENNVRDWRQIRWAGSKLHSWEFYFSRERGIKCVFHSVYKQLKSWYSKEKQKENVDNSHTHINECTKIYASLKTFKNAN